MSHGWFNLSIDAWEAQSLTEWEALVLDGTSLPTAGVTNAADCTVNCGPSCEWIFDRVKVYPQIDGGTRVEWTIHPQFADAAPYTFQLQVGRTSDSYADDWVNVGTAVVDTYYVVDSSQRAYGRFQWTHYRVVLSTSVGSYASKPQHVYGNLSKRDWLRAREIGRLEQKRLRKEAGQEGYLLKRRLFGTVCPDCTDSITGEVRNAQCGTCYGTGIVSGYYAPIPCVYAELSPHGTRSELDISARGTVNDAPRVQARMLNIPQLFSYDVWVDKDSDFRWIIHSIQHAVEIRGVPVVLHPVEMRLAPYSHPVYGIDITGQVPS
jgi:hypothetical protein